MNRKFIFSLIVLMSFVLTACDNSEGNLGEEIQPVDDRIVLKSDTFHIKTETVEIGHIVSRPDSLLLGTYVDDFLGITRSDFLTQFAIPTEDFTYFTSDVAETKADSAILTMNFRSYFGVATSPIEISVYELKKPLNKDEVFYSNLNPEEYVDFSKKVNAASELISIRDGITGELQSSLRIKLSDQFLDRLFTMDPQNYKTQEGFLSFFNGLYVTTNYGSSAMVNIAALNLSLHYHYIYKNDPSNTKIKSYQLYSANSEVVRVNRIQHPYRDLVLSKNDAYNYLASPSNYQAKIRLPIGEMKRRISVGEKQLDINRASIKVDVQDEKEWGLSDEIPYVNYVLLLKESEVDKFFRENSLPSDTASFLAALSRESVTATTYKYYYSIGNMSAFLKNELMKESAEEYIDMVLLPVTVKESASSSQSSVTAVVQSSAMQAVSIFSGSHPQKPMRMEVVYSGY